MAHAQTSSVAFNVAHAVSNVAASVAKSVVNFFEATAYANSRIDAIEALRNMSAEELKASYGITHDEIVSYVFRDKMF